MGEGRPIWQIAWPGFTQFGLAFLSLIGLSSAYFYGFVQKFGFGLGSLIDSQLMLSAVQITTLFLGFTAAYLRITTLTLVKWQSNQFKSELHGIAKNSPNDLESQTLITDQSLNEVSRFQNAISIVSVLLKVALFLFAGFIWLVLVARYFLDWQAVIAFLLSAVFLAPYVGIALWATSNDERRSHYPFWLVLYMGLSDLTDWRTYLSNSTNLSFLAALLLVLSFNFGAARFETLSRSETHCFSLEDGHLYGRLLAQSNSGYFLYLGEREDSTNLLSNTRSEVAFIERSQLIGILPNCENVLDA